MKQGMNIDMSNIKPCSPLKTLFKTKVKIFVALDFDKAGYQSSANCK